jgi:hypothetical protein
MIWRTGGEGLEGAAGGEGREGTTEQPRWREEGSKRYFCVRSVGEKDFYSSNANTVGEANSGMPLQICIPLLESV